MRVFAICLLLGSMIFSSGCGGPKDKDENVELVMFCAAGIKQPVTKIAEQYREEYNVNVRLQFGGSGTLLSSLRIAPGDIYLAADSSYTNEAKKLGLVSETLPVAFMKAGFGVTKGNPKNLSSLTDLEREGIRIGVGNPEAASVGKFTKKILSKHGAWEGLNPTVVFPTVNELANAIKLNTVDVVILWDAVAHQYPEIDFISVPEFDAEKKDVTVAVTKESKHPAEALKFCQYLSAPDKGKVVFQESGFEVTTN